MPSADAFRRVFQHLDAHAFNQAFLQWVRQLLPGPVVAQVCVDGHTLRGGGAQALHVVSALARTECAQAERALDGPRPLAEAAG